jgi:nitrogen fixation protein FixH
MIPHSPQGLTGRHVFAILVAFFGTIASADRFLLWSAVRTWSGAETTSAYKAGQLYGGEVARARAQAGLGWRLEASLERQPSGAAQVRVAARDANGAALLGRELSATLQRPTDKRADLLLDLTERPPGLYSGEVAAMAPGQWDLVIDVSERGERAFRRTTRLVLR